HAIEVDARDLPQLRDRVGERRHAGPPVRDRRAHRPLEDRDEEVVLAAEVEIDSAGADAGRAGHVGDLRVEEAALGEDVDRGAKNGLALVSLGGLRRAEGGDAGHWMNIHRVVASLSTSNATTSTSQVTTNFQLPKPPKSPKVGWELDLGS